MPAKIRAEKKAEDVIARILAAALVNNAEQISAWKQPGEDIQRLVRHDYVRSLRRILPYQPVRALLSAFHDILPTLNSEAVGMMSVERFAEIARELRVHFKASPYEGEEGLALRGFYVTSAKGMLKRPLIYINTAHHPLAVSTTICHEVGHHLSAQMFGSEADEPVHFFFDADYAGHLGDTGELAADAMVSFAGYPYPIAKKIFETPWNWGLVARAKDLTEAALAEVRGHVRRVYGFDLMERIPANQRLHYLSGMIHYAKLRWALLAEYDL
jgi:hypothetical protein